VLFYGGNSPAYWTLFGFAIIALFILQCGLTMARGGHWTNARLAVPALLYLSVLAWGLLQTWPAMPSAWAHPFWELVPDADATISATPVSGGHGVLRLATYAMIFWIALQASMNAKRAWRFLAGFGLFSTALAFFGLYAALSGTNPILLEDASSNVSASFINRNSYALYAAMGLVTNLGLYLDLVRSGSVPSGSQRGALRVFLERFFSVAWIFLFGAVICLSALLLTASRAGVASGLVAAAVVFVMLRRDNGGSRLVWLLAAILLGAFLTVLSENVLTACSEQQAMPASSSIRSYSNISAIGSGSATASARFRTRSGLSSRWRPPARSGTSPTAPTLKICGRWAPPRQSPSMQH
jgi:hypothetical protein